MFTDELPTLFDAERIPYGDLEKQIQALKEEIEGHKMEIKKTRNIPDDVAAKINVFIPVCMNVVHNNIILNWLLLS